MQEKQSDNFNDSYINFLKYFCSNDDADKQLLII
jgi:hypothetical protein